MVFAYSPSSPSTSYATSTPYAMDIPTSTTRSRSNSPSTPIAYPSWGASQSTSCIFSDEELFAPVFDDESSRDVTPPHTPHMSRSPAVVAAEHEPVFEQQRLMMAAVDSGSLLARQLAMQEKAKREQQRRRKAAVMRKSGGGQHKMKNMTTITE